jgi:thiosulfate/3-mercaptopyruvate sulfurtransferase
MASTLAGRATLPINSAVAGLPSISLMQAGDNPPYVIDVDSVRGLVENDPHAVRLIDVSPLRTYRAGHIPDAIHEFWEDTVDREYPHFGAVVTQSEEQRQRIDFVRKLAITQDMLVVAYDNAAGYRAARIVWFLRFLGFEQASLLDGGLQAWTGAGFKAQSGVNTIRAAASASITPQEGFYVVTRQLLDRIESQFPVIVDTRTDGERRDDLDGSIPTGAIPGSIRFPWTGMVDAETGRLRDTAVVESTLRQAGLTPDRQLILYSRFGVDTALPWLVLKHLGYQSVEIYDRGWVEWASRPDLPREPI